MRAQKIKIYNLILKNTVVVSYSYVLYSTIPEHTVINIHHAVCFAYNQS
jgi:hypothetical protein